MSTTVAFVRRLSLVVVVALVPLALIASLAPWLPVRGLGAVAVAFATTTLSLIASASILPYRTLARFDASAATMSVGTFAMSVGFALARIGRETAANEIVSGLIGSAGVLLLASSLGAMVGARVGHPGHLLAVALTSSAADVWSVHAPEGVTRVLVETSDTALQRLFAMSAAVPPSPVPEAMIGAGDVLFVAFYLSVAVRHGLRFTRMTTAIAIGLLAAGAMTFVLRQPLPALPFLGAAVLAAERRARTVEPRDRWPTALAGAILALSIARVALR